MHCKLISYADDSLDKSVLQHRNVKADRTTTARCPSQVSLSVAPIHLCHKSPRNPVIPTHLYR